MNRGWVPSVCKSLTPGLCPYHGAYSDTAKSADRRMSSAELKEHNRRGARKDVIVDMMFELGFFRGGKELLFLPQFRQELDRDFDVVEYMDKTLGAKVIFHKVPSGAISEVFFAQIDRARKWNQFSDEELLEVGHSVNSFLRKMVW